MNKQVRPILLILFFMLTVVAAKSQKWQPGHFTDVKGNTLSGFIKAYPSGRGPIKGENFVIFKRDKDVPETKISAGDLQNFVAGADSFVVAHPPINQVWPYEYDFVKVAVNEPVKLYVYKIPGAGGSGIHLSPEIGLGYAGGSYGGGGFGGGGLGISFGGGGGGPKQVYYFGANPAELTLLTPQNFEDVMSEIMGDDTEILEAIRNHQYNYGNIDKLIKYYKALPPPSSATK